MNVITRCFAMMILTSPLHAGIEFSKVFTAHMVLQRGMAVPVYGTAAAGEKVTVKFRDQSKFTTAGRDGKWCVKLDVLVAGGPDVLMIGEQRIEDVLVGDVWIGSGQSNMDMPVSGYAAKDSVLAAAANEHYPKIRLMKKGAGDVWEEARPDHIASFSALLFSFGFALQKEVDVPIGLMVGAVGGTPSGFWIGEEMYRGDAACAEAAKKFSMGREYAGLIERYNEAKTKFETDRAVWESLTDAEKKDGRKQPRAPKAMGKPGEAGTGKIGQLFEAHIRPYVGYGIKGVLWDQGESRTNILGVDQVTLMSALIRGWRKAWNQGDFPFLYVEKPSGGGCAFNDTQPMNRLSEKFAPLPKAIPSPPSPEYSHEVFSRFMKVSNTHMVTSSDLGPGIHPPNKSAYGARAVQVALATAYGRKIEYLGPCYTTHTCIAGKIILRFNHIGKGLASKNNEALQGFMIAGEDKKFVWACAKIEGDTIAVSSPDVPKPLAVRYAWASTFAWANLFNRDGLPAQPFRTDTW